MKNYLIQYCHEDDDEVCAKICTDLEIIKMVSESDFTGINNIVVYDFPAPGEIRKLRYLGWQPNNLIVFVDNDGNEAIRGYGEDH